MQESFPAPGNHPREAVVAVQDAQEHVAVRLAPAEEAREGQGGVCEGEDEAADDEEASRECAEAAAVQCAPATGSAAPTREPEPPARAAVAGNSAPAHTRGPQAVPTGTPSVWTQCAEHDDGATRSEVPPSDREPVQARLDADQRQQWAYLRRTAAGPAAWYGGNNWQEIEVDCADLHGDELRRVMGDKIRTLQLECDLAAAGPKDKARAKQIRGDVDPSTLPFELPTAEKHCRQVNQRAESTEELRRKPMPSQSGTRRSF